MTDGLRNGPVPRESIPLVLRGWGTCIYCMNNPANTKEHIIQKTIGGFLEAWLACDKCNNEMGQATDLELKDDTNVRLAFESIKTQTPKAFNSYRKRQKYIAHSESGENLSAVFKGDALFVHWQTLEDGSSPVDASQSEKFIKTELLNSGASEAEIRDKLEEFRNAENGRLVEIAKGFGVKKLAIVRLTPVLSGKFISDHLVLKIAYNILSLLITPNNHSEYFEPIATSILNRSTIPPYVEFRQGMSNESPKPYHRFSVEKVDGAIRVAFFLFDALMYAVTFHRASLDSEISVRIVMNLKSREIYPVA